MSVQGLRVLSVAGQEPEPRTWCAQCPQCFHWVSGSPRSPFSHLFSPGFPVGCSDFHLLFVDWRSWVVQKLYGEGLFTNIWTKWLRVSQGTREDSFSWDELESWERTTGPCETYEGVRLWRAAGGDWPFAAREVTYTELRFPLPPPSLARRSWENLGCCLPGSLSHRTAGGSTEGLLWTREARA